MVSLGDQNHFPSNPPNEPNLNLNQTDHNSPIHASGWSSVPLGPVDELTKPEAKRKLQVLLGQLGVNTEAHLFGAMNVSRTFEQEAAWWRENKLSLFKPSCQETMGSHIDKYLLPRFGELSIDAVDERR